MGKISTITAPVACLLLSGPVSAAETVSDTFDVTAQVVASCSISSTIPLEFPDPNSGATAGAVGEITLSCTDQLPYEVALNSGTHYDSTSSVRTMENPAGDSIAYRLFKDAGRTSEWGDSSRQNTYPAGDTLTGTGSGAAEALTIFGQSVKSLSTIAPAGEYSDFVNVTLYF